MKILLLIAMEKEAKPIITLLNMAPALPEHQLPEWLQTTVYYTSINNNQVFLVMSGKDVLHGVDSLGSGIVSTATLALHILNPDLVINAGSAGGVSLKGCAPGDIYLCNEKVAFHDQLLAPDTKHMPYGVGSYPLIDTSYIAKQLQVKNARISTGSSLLPSEADTKQFQENDAALKDMEAAHIGRLCTQAKKNLLIIKVVSDLIDSEECPQEQFSRNIIDVMQVLALKLKDLINFITTKPKSITDNKIYTQNDLHWLCTMFNISSLGEEENQIKDIKTFTI